MTRLGYQIPNFTYPGVDSAGLFDVVAMQAQAAERSGFDTVLLMDHFYQLPMLGDPDFNMLECYTTLGALARETSKVRLGALVTGNTYRNPAFLLKQAVTVDHISGGRVDFGVGAGWVEREHEAYGWDYPSARARVDRFAEALEIWELLQRQEWTTYRGRYYDIIDAPFAPKPLQSRMPMLIGGSKPRMLALSARYADIWNVVGLPEDAGEVNRQLDDACRAIGRNPASLVRSVSPRLNLLASVEAFAEGVAAYHAAGFRHIYLPWPRTPAEVPVLREVARDVLPGFRAHEPQGAAASLRRLTASDHDLLRAVLAADDNPVLRQVLAVLIAHPGERFDGAALMARTGFATHAEITLALAGLAARLAEHGLARPWSEAQQGWMVPGDQAEVLGSALGEIG